MDPRATLDSDDLQSRAPPAYPGADPILIEILLVKHLLCS